MRITWTSPALEDFINLQNFIAQDNPSAAYSVANRIKEALSKLYLFPKIGREGRVPNTRELIIPNTSFIVPYEIQQETIYILAVFHSSRKWP